MSDFDLKPGMVVGDKYEVGEQLGAGGMGVVFEARHMWLDRRVAVKLLRTESMHDDPEFRARFTREARVMSRLDHPNAVTVYDYGEHEGALFIAMEYLVGHSLEAETGDGPIDRWRALEICLQMCDVLTCTHEIGLIHRDIKPENIFITDTDAGPHATLVDFGLAFISSDEDLNRMTQEGAVTGTPQFLSPEQAKGEDIGPASDIYSLGCVLYELLCGHPAVEGATFFVLLNAHVYVPATSMRVKAPDLEIPAALDNFVLSMLAKSADARPSAFEASKFLRKFLASEDMRGRGRPARLLQPRSRRAVTAANAAVSGASGANASGSSDDDSGPVLGVIGELSSELMVAAHASGWTANKWSEGASYDVVVAMSPGLVTPVITAKHPTLAVVGEASISGAVTLLEMGVDDILVDDEPDEILRKAARLRESRMRRGHK